MTSGIGETDTGREGPARVAAVAAELPEGKFTLFVFVSDDLIVPGVRADAIIREVAEKVGGKGWRSPPHGPGRSG